MNTVSIINDRPRIGIPVRLAAENGVRNDSRMDAARVVFDAVVALIKASGADAILIEAAEDNDLYAAMESCQGFVVPGGGDVDPTLYGGPDDHPTLFGVNPSQDILDGNVLRYAFQSQRPLLAICRGMQLMNVLHGGTLQVDLETGVLKHSLPPVTGLELAVHDVEIGESSRCAKAYNDRVISVSSAHHQAVDILGKGLHAVAFASDGLVEAIESDNHPWFVGIQWHPEADIPQARLRLPMFSALVAEAKRVEPSMKK